MIEARSEGISSIQLFMVEKSAKAAIDYSFHSLALR
jgi:hypothetical protein